jgi:CBS domain-containing protein
MRGPSALLAAPAWWDAVVMEGTVTFKSSLPRHRTVSDVMTNRVHVATPSAPFKHLVRVIEENRVSAIPIVDQQGVPIGIVSEWDLMLKERRRELESSNDLTHPQRRRHQRARAVGTIASELMTTPVITVTSDMSLSHAARLMHEKKVRRLVVVDQRGRIAGMVSQSDLLQVFLRSDEELRGEIADPSIALDYRELST